MPNPSTIAMEDEAAETPMPTPPISLYNDPDDPALERFSEMFVNTKPSSPLTEALMAVLDDVPLVNAPAYVEFDVVVVPENTPDEVLKMMEALDEEFADLELGFEMTAGIMTEAVEALAEEQAKVRDLTAALGHIGQRNIELEGKTPATTIELAAARFVKAKRAFDQMESSMLEGASGYPDRDVQDRITQEIAEADADLEQLLEAAGLLP